MKLGLDLLSAITRAKVFCSEIDKEGRAPGTADPGFSEKKCYLTGGQRVAVGE
jgi:hypothetical protein